MHTPDDAVRAVLNLIRSIGGEHVGTTGGKRGSRRSSVKTRSKSAGAGTDPDSDDAGGNDDGQGNAGESFGNPMTTEWDLMRGGTGGAAVRLALGPEGTVLASIGGQLAWVYPTALGVPVEFLTYLDGMTEYDVTDGDDVPLWA